MAVKASRVDVGVTPTRLDTAETDRSWQSLLVRNTGAASVYLGDATVTTTTGFELAADTAVSLTLTPEDEDEPIYAVAASGTVTVHILEQGV